MDCKFLCQRIGVVVALGIGFAWVPGGAFAQSTSRASVDSSGVEGTGTSERASVSADGRYVAFESKSDSFVAGDTNMADDVFVRDTQTGTTVRVSVSSAGVEGDAASVRAVISADGRYVAFGSDAANFAAGDTQVFDAVACPTCTGFADIFVHDRDPDGNGVFDEGNGTTVRVSVSTAGVAGDGDSSRPSISDDGQRIAFRSSAANFDASDTNGVKDVYVHDLQAGTTVRASVSTGGAEADAKSDRPSISGNGQFVAFFSDATNLVTGDGNAARDVFVRDLDAGTTLRISVPNAGGDGDAGSSRPALSGDGRFVAFYSDATNLVAGDTNALRDIFLNDRDPDGNGVFDEGNGVTTIVTTGADGASSSPAISDDGSTVGFDSTATNLVPTDTNGVEDAFIFDRATGVITRLSQCTDDVGGDAISSRPSLSADGRIVGFHSSATNLVVGDGNAKDDVFIRDLDAPLDSACLAAPPATGGGTGSTGGAGTGTAPRPCGAMGMLGLPLLMLGLTLMRPRRR